MVPRKERILCEASELSGKLILPYKLFFLMAMFT